MTLPEPHCRAGTSFTYDAENHLVSTGGQTYLYDGDGKRIAKAPSNTPTQPSTIYWYGNGSNNLVETDSSGNLLYRHYYFNGMHLMRHEATVNWMDHYALDALGSVRFVYSYETWNRIHAGTCVLLPLAYRPGTSSVTRGERFTGDQAKPRILKHCNGKTECVNRSTAPSAQTTPQGSHIEEDNQIRFVGSPGRNGGIPRANPRVP